MQRSAFTLLMLGSGVPSGGLLKTAGSSSSSSSCSADDRGGCRVGLTGLQGVVEDGGAGWSFTSGFLEAGSRAVGDRARLACRGREGGGGVGLVHFVLYILNITTMNLKVVLKW